MRPIRVEIEDIEFQQYKILKNANRELQEHEKVIFDRLSKKFQK